MSYLFTPEETAFRADVRAFVQANLPEDIRDAQLGGRLVNREQLTRWTRILHARGWAAYTWPQAHGGPGFSPVQRHIFEDECAQAGAPELLPFGLKMVAPVLMAFGNAWQKQHYLPRIADLSDWWCQGYSEPGAGSDLAGLRTRAELDGEHYIVNGQKTWTTLAQDADWMFCLVRTENTARKQEGISFLLIDLRSPGVTIRPIITIDGAHEVNEVWFQDVRVPACNLVGEPGKGWTYAKYLLVHERLNFGGMGFCKREIARLKRMAAKVMRGGRPALENPLIRNRLAVLEMRLASIDMTNLRILRAAERGESDDRHAPYLKIISSELQQDIAELQSRILGQQAAILRQDGNQLREEALAALTYCNLRKTTIYAGSNEIQRNIAARQLLG